VERNEEKREKHFLPPMQEMGVETPFLFLNRISPRLASNSRSFCLSFLSAKIKGLCHHAWHNPFYEKFQYK
jgi:hypothetical protein